MRTLKETLHKQIKLTSKDGEQYTGKVGDFIEGKYNDPSYEDCIVLDNCIRLDDDYAYNLPVQFNQSEIATIEYL